jgi:hypothetical protein
MLPIIRIHCEQFDAIEIGGPVPAGAKRVPVPPRQTAPDGRQIPDEAPLTRTNLVTAAGSRLRT